MKLFMWHIFIRWPAEETSIGLTNVSLNGDSFSWKAAFAHLVCPVLTTLWMCYRTIKGILSSCESLCLLFSMLFNFWKKIQNLSFWYFFLGWFLLCGIVVGHFEIVLGRLWIVVVRCGSFRVLVTMRNSTATTEEWDININEKASNWGNFQSKFATGSEDEQASLWPLTSCPRRAVQEKSGPYRSSGVFCTLCGGRGRALRLYFALFQNWF